MENRKIIIVSTKTQRKYTLTTDASTLAELKSVCDANNIDYEGMSWFEGTSKTEMKSDNSVLPHDVPYKGTVTNNLVFRLTPTKKIASGMNRIDAYAVIRDSKLQQYVKDTYGKNFTQLSNAVLEEIVAKVKEKEEEDIAAPISVEKGLDISLQDLLSVLFMKGVISAADFLDLNKKEKEDEIFSDAEIEEMFRD